MSVHSEIRCDGCGLPDPRPAVTIIFYTARSTRARLAEIGWTRGSKRDGADYCPKCTERRARKALTNSG